MGRHARLLARLRPGGWWREAHDPAAPMRVRRDVPRLAAARGRLGMPIPRPPEGCTEPWLAVAPPTWREEGDFLLIGTGFPPRAELLCFIYVITLYAPHYIPWPAGRFRPDRTGAFRVWLPRAAVDDGECIHRIVVGTGDLAALQAYRPFEPSPVVHLAGTRLAARPEFAPEMACAVEPAAGPRGTVFSLRATNLGTYARRRALHFEVKEVAAWEAYLAHVAVKGTEPGASPGPVWWQDVAVRDGACFATIDSDTLSPGRYWLAASVNLAREEFHLGLHAEFEVWDPAAVSGAAERPVERWLAAYRGRLDQRTREVMHGQVIEVHWLDAWGYSVLLPAAWPPDGRPITWSSYTFSHGLSIPAACDALYASHPWARLDWGPGAAEPTVTPLAGALAVATLIGLYRPTGNPEDRESSLYGAAAHQRLRALTRPPDGAEAATLRARYREWCSAYGYMLGAHARAHTAFLAWVYAPDPPPHWLGLDDPAPAPDTGDALARGAPPPWPGLDAIPFVDTAVAARPASATGEWTLTQAVRRLLGIVRGG